MGQNFGVFQHYKHKHYLGDGAPFHTNFKAQKSTIITHTVANRKYPSNCADHTLSTRTSQNGTHIQLAHSSFERTKYLWISELDDSLLICPSIAKALTSALSKEFIPSRL
jgi:hypothetical protein